MKNKTNKFLCFLSTILILTFSRMNGVLAADCDGIFGDPNTEGDLAFMINKYMGYFRILAPVLVITFGSVDLIKAVIASNPDQMKKAQNTLIKRIFIGVGLFFVPTVVNIIINFASMAEGYEICDFKW